MAGIKDKTIIEDPNEAALQKFEAGLARSVKQYEAGEVETFDYKDEFLRTLVD